MIGIIICIFSLLMDGYLTNFLPYIPENLSYLTPMLTIVSIYFLYPFFRKEEKKFYIILGILGIVYDLLYTNLLFTNAIIFIGLGIISKYIYKNLEQGPIRTIFYILLLLVIYESTFTLLVFIFQLVPITLERFLYKVKHSIILNLIYGEVIFIILKIIPEKWKKIAIN